MMYKLLVVDDEHDVCDFLRTFFKERGFHVFTALNADEALSIAKRESPELILLEIQLKGMDGLAVLKHIRELDRRPKVIIMTALNDEEKMHEAYKLGAVDYITKPLTLDYLEDTVGKNLKIKL